MGTYFERYNSLDVDFAPRCVYLHLFLKMFLLFDYDFSSSSFHHSVTSSEFVRCYFWSHKFDIILFFKLFWFCCCTLSRQWPVFNFLALKLLLQLFVTLFSVGIIIISLCYALMDCISRFNLKWCCHYCCQSVFICALLSFSNTSFNSVSGISWISPVSSWSFPLL